MPYDIMNKTPYLLKHNTLYQAFNYFIFLLIMRILDCRDENNTTFRTYNTYVCLKTSNDVLK